MYYHYTFLLLLLLPALSAGALPKHEIDISNNNKNTNLVFQALQVEYREMASWYDWFWKSYTRETLKIPLDLVMMQQQAKESCGRLRLYNKNTFTVVDVACGTGELLKRIIISINHQTKHNKEHDEVGEKKKGIITKFLKQQQQLSLVGIEPCTEMLEQAHRKLSLSSSLQQQQLTSASASASTMTTATTTTTTLKQAPAEELPLKDSSADIVTCTNAFHFFRDKSKALLEMKRVLKSDGTGTTGTLIITDWCQDFWMVKMYHLLEKIRWNWRFVDKYPGPLSSKELLTLLQNAGFVDVSLTKYVVRVFW
eukprot:CAMPEP_0198142952 /NCGR_PEP_ID=MMETSP1443-20131203/5610_1 /TAXON_ID=186043 /ORGANISM="Entomoneis sp., Strain CCMP2396" /LENGTH=309 /DNA_ID=CAMNT_0043806085 /DNA_START=57 /DNA_END=983 /DNA_ORIENTATION=-